MRYIFDIHALMIAGITLLLLQRGGGQPVDLDAVASVETV